jgi:hypothetical protein
MPLNGAAANTEGGRLQRKIQGARMCYTSGDVSSMAYCGPKASIQFPITQSENSRITLLTATMNGTLLNSGGVTQERAKQILAAGGVVGATMTETVRTNLLQQRTIACSADSPTLEPIILPGCPPLPPPPAPPARACPLTKNQKF